MVTNVGGNLYNLKRLTSEKEQMLLNTKLDQIRYVLRDELKPFRSYQVVDQFLAQSNVASTPCCPKYAWR